MIILKILIVSKNIVNTTMFFLFYSIISIGDFMGNLIIISGPSGVGKGTIINRIKEKYKNNNKKLYVSVSYTTRNPRDGEINGRDYYFISVQEFKELINNNGLLEYNEYGTGKYYGTPRDIIFNYLDNDYDVILEIDVNGYKKIKELGIEHRSVFVAPSSIGVLESRLRKRNSEDEENLKKRIKEAFNELNYMNLYDDIVFNEDGKLEEAVDEVYELMNSKKYIK